MTPKNLEECFVVLKQKLSKQQLDEFKKLKDDDLIQCHFGLGMWMRNSWGLWHGGDLSKDLERRGVNHPDDMSGYIIREFHRHLNEKDPNVIDRS